MEDQKVNIKFFISVLKMLQPEFSTEILQKWLMNSALIFLL